MASTYNLPGRLKDVTPSATDSIIAQKTRAIYATNNTNDWLVVKVDSIGEGDLYDSAVAETVVLDVPPQSIMVFYGCIVKVWHTGTTASKVVACLA